MPTLIVSTASDPKNGIINHNDLATIIDGFGDVQMQSPSRPIIKVDSVYIPAVIMKHLLEKIGESDINNAGINVKFSVTLPDQKDCTDQTTDVSNHLTIAIVIEKDGRERMEVGDFVITPGFREFAGEHGIGDGACCPVINPTPKAPQG